MQVINKKTIIVIFICLCIISFGLFKLFNKEKVILDDVILDINNSKDNLAIYIEEYDDNGNASYVESEDNTFPIEDYVYNKELSGCLDSNSNEVEDALNYNYVDKELNLRVNRPVTCYVYYDYKGDGTETVPYKIRSIEDLLDLSLNTTKGNNHTNEYFELTRDLDFRDINSYNDSERTDYGNLNGITTDGNTLMNELTTGTGWVPIGTSNNNFYGIFDGNNKRIDNLYLKKSSAGLFLVINNATIKNLTLSGDIKMTSGNGGGFVSTTFGNSIIDNCHNEVNVTSLANSGSTGGIIGGTGGTEGAKLIIKNSSNKGNISGSNNTGGIIGAHATDLTIENSHNEGIITNSLGQHAGGLLGRDNGSTNTTKILNSYNNGEVIVDGNDRETNLGGLIGNLSGQIYINNSYNEGNIETNIGRSEYQHCAGGLIGRSNNKIIITSSKNEGSITGGNRIGGLIGLLYGNSTTIMDKSYNIGTISPSSEEYWSAGLTVGGIVNGIMTSKMYLINSYNSGELYCDSKTMKGTCGGIVQTVNGNGTTFVLLNSYNNGSLTGELQKGGIAYIIANGSEVFLNNVFNLGHFSNNITKYGIGQFNIQGYNVKSTYYVNENNIEGSNLTNEEGIIGKDLTEMQSDAFVAELNKNIESINISDYIDDSLLTEFKNTTGYDLKLSKWTLKEGIPTLIDIS